MSRSPRFVVFDLDGTLVDSRRDIADAANALIERSGATPLSEETIGRMVGEGAATLVQRAFAAVAMPPPPDALRRFVEIYATRLLVHTRPYAGIREVLAALREECALAVLTNKPNAATRSILEGLGLSAFFEPTLVLGGDSEHGRKPAPDGLNWLMRRAGVDAGDTLLVGDSVIDWETAQAAGVEICLASYGFGFESIPPEISGAASAVRNPIDLLNYVRNEYG